MMICASLGKKRAVEDTCPGHALERLLFTSVACLFYLHHNRLYFVLFYRFSSFVKEDAELGTQVRN